MENNLIDDLETIESGETEESINSTIEEVASNVEITEKTESPRPEIEDVPSSGNLHVMIIVVVICVIVGGILGFLRGKKAVVK